MKDSHQLKVRCSIIIAEKLMKLPEFEGMSITKIIHKLTEDKLKSAEAHRGRESEENFHIR